MAPSSAVVNPNLGLYLDRPAIAMNPRMLQDGLNFRVKEGKLSNLNLGWTRFESSITLNGPVLLIESFTPRSQGLVEQLIFATATDTYVYDPTNHWVRFITPRYETGTASASGTAVTGVGTAWSTFAMPVRIGDQIYFGAIGQRDPAAAWFTVATVNTDTSITLTASAGTQALGPYTIRRRHGGGVSTKWSTAQFIKAPSGNDQFWMTNGVDPIMRWNALDTFLHDPAVGLVFNFKAAVTTVFSNMLMFGNLVISGSRHPTDIVNSAPGDPTNFAGGLSEQLRVHSGSDEISAMEQLGDNLIIYSKNHIIAAQFVGDPFIFILRSVATGIGPVSGKAIADFGDYHEFIGADSQYAFDGVSVREINKHVWRSVLHSQDPVRISKTFNHFDLENGDLLWAVPLTTDAGSGTATSPPAKAYVEHYLEKASAREADLERPHSLREFPFTATGYFTQQTGVTWDLLTQTWDELTFSWDDQLLSASFPLNMMGSNDGKIYTLNTSQNADTVALRSFVRFGRRATVDGQMRGLITRIHPFVDAFANALKVTTSLTDHAMGSPTISQIDSFDQSLPEGGHFVTPYRRGRYYETEFGTDGPSEPWALSGYNTIIKGGGNR